jgi:hypothetical protein
LIWKTLLAILFNRFSLFSGGKEIATAPEAEPEVIEKPVSQAAPAPSEPDEEKPASPLARLKG